jgi:hypothetical protein
MKNILLSILKIIVGFIICQIIIVITNYIIGFSLFYLSDKDFISMEQMAYLLNSFFIIYLPFILITIIIGIIILRDYLKDNKLEILWKLLVLIICYVFFELRIISLLLM